MKQLCIFGETFREGDLSPDEYEMLETAVGYAWGYVFTAMGREAKALRRGSAALLQRKLGITEQDALAKVDSLTMVELSAALTDYDDQPKEWEDGLPLEADEG